jgi:outer membrane lipoprotein-sorting protein
MNSADNIEKIVSHVSFRAGPEMDQRLWADTRRAQEQSQARTATPNGRRRLNRTMRNSHTKWAVAAMIPLAVMLSVLVSEALREPAWAIEQTIAALEGFRAVYATGIFSLDGKTEVQAESWARPNKDGTRSGDMRIQTTSGYCIVVNEDRDSTHIYDPARNAVEIRGGDGLYCRPWVNGDYFRHMKEACEEWREEYTKDAATGRRCVMVKARNLHDGQSYEFHFDLQTKLPLRGKVWQNPDFIGSPYFNIDKIVYNPALPEGIFDFQIPAGATIVGGRSPGLVEKLP